MKKTPDKINTPEYHAKICIDVILEFRDQIKFPTDIEYCEWDKRKLSDYNLQHFRYYLQKKIKKENF